MKKNVMLKIASVLMVAVLLTTCAISSTFAKYVTATETMDSNLGSVAKWGVKISAGATDKELFAKTYAGINDKTAVASGVTPQIAVVAPGTTGSNSAFALTISGQPEVACAVTLGGSVNLSGWEVPVNADSKDTLKFYCPIVFSVNGEAVDTDDCTTKEDYSKAVMDKIAAELFGTATYSYNDGTKEYVAKYEVNHNFGTETVGTKVEISWAWAFPTTENVETDRMDTYLGNQAAEGNAATIEISYNLGVEQIAEGVDAPAAQG